MNSKLTTLNDKPARLEAVDIAKGIGIIFVVIGHVMQGVFDAGITIDEFSYRLAYDIIYSFHMPMFFLISGLFFFSTLDYVGSRQMVKQKVGTILYPYILWFIIQGSLEFLAAGIKNNPVEASIIFAVWEPRMQFWFLYALFAFVITTCFIFHNLGKGWIFLLLPMSLLVYLNPDKLPEGFIFYYFSGFYVYFATGLAISLIPQRFYAFTLPTIIAVIAPIAISLLYFYGRALYSEVSKTQTMLTYFLALAMIFYILFFSKWLAAACKPSVRATTTILSYLGKHSLVIYLIHIIAASGIRIVLIKLGVQNSNIHLIAGVFSGILAPLVVMKATQVFGIRKVFSW